MKKTKFFFLYIIVLIFLTTYTPKLLQDSRFTSSGYFTVKNIEITNNFFLSSNDIKLNLSHFYTKNIFFLDEKDMIRELKKIDFIESFKIRKIFPNKIQIKIKEEKPVGIINDKKNKFFITSSDHLVKYRKNSEFENLPNVFGINAEKEFTKFHTLLNKNNFPIEKIKNYYFFKINRWDLHLIDDKVIKLPSENVVKAIKKSIIILQNSDFKKYLVIDLRIDDKIITQ